MVLYSALEHEHPLEVDPRGLMLKSRLSARCGIGDGMTRCGTGDEIIRRGIGDGMVRMETAGGDGNGIC